MKRTLIFANEAREDFLYWRDTDRSLLRRINQLIKDVRRSPYEGIGKPESLKHQLAGWWSRRIDSQHRMIYRVTEPSIEIAHLRHHY